MSDLLTTAPSVTSDTLSAVQSIPSSWTSVHWLSWPNTWFWGQHFSRQAECLHRGGERQVQATKMSLLPFSCLAKSMQWCPGPRSCCWLEDKGVAASIGTGWGSPSSQRAGNSPSPRDEEVGINSNVESNLSVWEHSLFTRSTFCPLGQHLGISAQENWKKAKRQKMNHMADPQKWVSNVFTCFSFECGSYVCRCLLWVSEDAQLAHCQESSSVLTPFKESL